VPLLGDPVTKGPVVGNGPVTWCSCEQAPVTEVSPTSRRVWRDFSGTRDHQMAEKSALEQRLLDHAPDTQWVQRALGLIRSEFGMDVAYVSEFRNGQRIFRFVDASIGHATMLVDRSDPEDETYCRRIVDGRLPEVIGDTSAIPEAVELPITRELGIGSHIGVAIRFPAGTVYGTLGCFSSKPDRSFRVRDLSTMRGIASLLGRYFERERRDSLTHAQAVDRMRHTMKGLSITFQPIVELRSGRAFAFEALARFHGELDKWPDVWFAEATRLGLGTELELHALQTALQHVDDLPGDARMSINASPSTIMSEAFSEAVREQSRGRIIIEVTERAPIDSYRDLRDALKTYRSAGLRFAVDDTGKGFTSFRRIMNLEPDIIKLDKTLARGAATDPARQAMVKAMVWFAAAVGPQVVAQHIETALELRALWSMGIRYGQGYLLGRPGPLSEVARDSARRGVRALLPRPATVETSSPTREAELTGAVRSPSARRGSSPMRALAPDESSRQLNPV
jgi:EAL domain-containing protein (putative c-di-GMP-specific phosphodiesterase class I)